jgi:hypothetical protein
MRAPGQGWRLVVPLVALALGGLPGCSGDDRGSAAPTGTSTPTVADPGIPMPPPVGTLDAPPPTASTATPSVTPSVSRRPTRAAAPASPARPPAALPKAVQPVQGRSYWAVFATVTDSPEDPALGRAEQQLRKLGYRNPSRGEVDCLEGARQALHLTADRPYYEIDVLFATKAEAQRLSAAYPGKVAGIASVRLFCVD